MTEAMSALRVLLATAGIVAVGALTPGPNNLIVLERAARGGFASALPAVAAITTGSVALILVAAGSAGMLLDGRHWLRAAVTIGGCAYLGWLGIRLLIATRGDVVPDVVARAPAVWSDRAWSLFAFQFVNPKGWAIALTASTALEESRSLGAALLDLAALFALIPAVCLLLWSAAGAALSRHLRRPHLRLAFERALGLLLLSSAILVML